MSKKPLKTLECVKCNANFANFSLLRQHFINDHVEEKRCYIICCNRKFVSRYQIVEHIRLHRDPNAYRCDICGNTFCNSSNLAIHVIDVHSGKDGKKRSLQCPNCLKIMLNKRSLIIHIKTHKTKRYYSSEEERKSHMHLLRRKHMCTLCEKAFRSPRDLREHMTTHTGKRLYKCRHCEKTFKQSSSMYTHHKKAHPQEWTESSKKRGNSLKKEKMQIKQENIKSEPPKLPDKNDDASNETDAHQKSKENDTIAVQRSLKCKGRGVQKRKLPCDLCSSQFKSHSDLKHHKQLVHKCVTVYVCSECGKVANTEFALRTHKRNVHLRKRKYKCTVCEKAFKFARVLRDHMTTHTGERLYKCQHCERTFKSFQGITYHRKTVHPQEWAEHCSNKLHKRTLPLKKVKYKCTLCEKVFKYKRVLLEHMSTHTGEHLYKGPYCVRTFKSSQGFTYHRKTVHPQEWAEYLSNRPQLTKVQLNENKICELNLIY